MMLSLGLALALLLTFPPALPMTFQGAPPAAPVVRPRDPWVFRSVLDGRPRIVTIALDDEMWVAYDATTCGLYRAWKGGVRFAGAVYTTEHGPQPTSEGPSYTEGYDEPTWEVTTAEGRVPARAVWRGYRTQGTRAVRLLYDVLLPDGRAVRVEETPEFVRPMDRFTEEQIDEMAVPSDTPGLLRTFHAIDVPEGVKLSVRVRTDGALYKQSMALERESFEDVPTAGGDVETRIHSHLVLGGRLPVNYVLLFFRPLDATGAQPGGGGGGR
jgi:hypothetical protein